MNAKGSSFFVSMSQIFIVLVIWAAFIPLSFSIAGLNIRASQMFLPIVCVVLLMEARKAPIGRMQMRLFFAGVLLWFSFLFWTLWNSASYPELISPFGHVGLWGLNFIHALVAYALVVKSRRPDIAAYTFSWSVTVFNVMLVLLSIGKSMGFALSPRLMSTDINPILVNGEVVAADVDRFVTGVMTGNISVAVLVMASGFILGPSTPLFRRRSLWIIIVTSVIGVIIGFSRQAVISAVGGFGILVLYMVRKGRVGKLFALGTVMVAILVLALLTGDVPVLSGYFQAFAGRAALLIQTDSYQTGTTGSRMDMWTRMMTDVSANPLAGSGQDAYLKYFKTAEEQGSHSFPIEVLHACGIWGFVPYLYLHIAVVSAAWALLRRGHVADPTSWLMLGLLGGLIAVILGSFSNLIFWGPQYWVLLGISIGTIKLWRQPMA